MNLTVQPKHQLVRRGTEWMVATMTTLWGAALLLPGDAYLQQGL